MPQDPMSHDQRRPGDGRAAIARPRIPTARLDAFLQHLAETGDVSLAAERTGLRRTSLYKLRNSSETFAARWTEALDLGLDRLQDHAVNRATVGVEKPVWRGGEQVGTVLHPDNRLLQFLLKAHRPEVYDRGKATAAARPFDLIRRMAEAEKRMAAFEAAEAKKKAAKGKAQQRSEDRHG